MNQNNKFLQKYFSTRNLAMGAMSLALAIVLPWIMHSIPRAGQIFLPMHIPVLICGFVCGWPLGLLVGALAPLLNHLVTGMPPQAIIVQMTVELAVYGLLAGILYRFIRTKDGYVDIYLSLIFAMLGGRIVYGLLNALIFNAGSYGWSVWLTGMFVTAWPGIVIQLVLVPAVVIALRKAKLIPPRY
ncbi:MAG: ECF transporter S component [Clostridiaceae bacterium]|nr:ECF transporter S component [Clostridiaceae bacterium]